MKRSKETLIYLIGTIIVSVLGFILSVLYSSMFTPSDYGKYSLILSLYSLFSQFFFGWIPLSFIRNYMLYSKNNKSDKLISSLMILHLLFSTIFCLLINTLCVFTKIDKFYKILVFIFSLIYYFENQILLINSLMRVSGKSKEYSKNTTINSFLKIIFVILLFYIFKFKSVLIISLSLLISEFIQFVYLMFKNKLFYMFSFDKFEFKIIKEMIKYGYPLIGISITCWILNVSDRYIIQLFNSAADVGIYSYSYNLSNSIFNMLMQFIMLGAFPNIVKAWEKSGKNSAELVIKDYLNLFFLIVLPACAGVIALSNQFFTIFTNESYVNGYSVFLITSIGISILGFSQYTNKVWELTKRTKTLFVLNVVTAILNIIFNFICIPVFGYQAAAFTTTVCYLIYVVISLILSRKIMKLKIDYNQFFKILCSTLIMFLFLVMLKKTILIDNILMFLVSVVGAIIIYIICVFLFKIINFKDIIKLLQKRGI